MKLLLLLPEKQHNEAGNEATSPAKKTTKEKIHNESSAVDAVPAPDTVDTAPNDDAPAKHSKAKSTN
jgi:hypothetical protein